MAEVKNGNGIERVRRQAEAVAHDIERAFPPEDFAPTAFVASMQMSGDAFQHFLETGHDMARFYNVRLAKDLKYANAFSSCRSPVDVAALWGKIASEAVHDYADQLDRVLAINFPAGSEETEH